MFQSELYNMCMICDPRHRKVLVEDKIPDEGWGGITFPGGHVEPGESFADSMIREVREETGLTVSGLDLMGTIHYFDPDRQRQWICFLYRTCSYAGELKSSGEGRVFWTGWDSLPSMKLAPRMEQYLRIFAGEAQEAFAQYGTDYADPLRFY